MTARHRADSRVDTDRLGAWCRSRLEAPNHTAGNLRDPFDNRTQFIQSTPDPFGRTPGDVVILRFPDGNYSAGTEFEILRIGTGAGPLRYVVRRYGNYSGTTSTILADKFERN